MSGSHSAPETIGVLGGTFDPVHEGHLRIADHARERLGWRRTLLMPAALPPHKTRAEVETAPHREAMLRLAVRGRVGLEISTFELHSGRVCYTIDTLRQLRDGRPACRPVFILGMDSVREIVTWKDWRQLIEEFDLAAFDRPDHEPPSGPGVHEEVAARMITAAPDASPEAWEVGCGGRIFVLPAPPIPISSSAIRARARAGLDLGSLVPPDVARYIHDMGLYRQEKDH
jgi:nicotinate-nucleotide adenylyltransferase